MTGVLRGKKEGRVKSEEGGIIGWINECSYINQINL